MGQSNLPEQRGLPAVWTGQLHELCAWLHAGLYVRQACPAACHHSAAATGAPVAQQSYQFLFSGYPSATEHVPVAPGMLPQVAQLLLYGARLPGKATRVSLAPCI